MKKIVEDYYRSEYDALVKRMYFRLGNTQDAEDVVQEAFTRSLKYLDSFDPKKCTDFNQWFSTILTNVVRNFQGERLAAGITRNIEDSTDELDPIIPDHISALSKKEIDKLINKKGGLTKEILRLNLMFGYTPKDISFLLNVNVNTIYVYLSNFSTEVKEKYT